MDEMERRKLIEDLESKSEHDVLILTAATVSELKENFKTVCADVKDHGTRLTVLETNWKVFGIVSALALIGLAFVDLVMR